MLTWDEIDIADTQPLAHYQIIRRNGSVVAFEPSKIEIAMRKAYLAVHGKNDGHSGNVEHCLCVYEMHQAGSRMVAFMSLHIHRLLVRPLLRSRADSVACPRLICFFWSGKVNLRNAP
ncbi:hypothetical protein [Polaromonas glacialis]|uniref:hypothetical protein n=1 Tax=Polaromonas glacialis TaxID=866564 RepID=UPI000A0573A5|nr:hypothetical protein [Polaromonas glacialis]